MIKQREKDIILFVNNAPQSSIEEIRQYGKKNKKSYRIAVLRDTKRGIWKKSTENNGIDISLDCDFSNPYKIAKTLLPYQDYLLAITCRAEVHIPYFAKVIPHVPYLKTPTSESLDWANQKIMMRKRFRIFDKNITPKFFVVEDSSKKTLKTIKEKVGFPLIIKPSGLASSLLVSVCYYEEELEKTLRDIFRKIKKIYKENDRKKAPELLAEQFMEGDMYSVDAYITSRGKVYFCPLVKVKTGKQIGFDDFFGYQRIVPTTLKKSSIEQANSVTKKALHALGLRSTSVHVELMETDDGWKVVEVGPRIGGYRDKMYKLSYGINHALNDVLIRIPFKPIISRRVKGHTAVFQIFAKEEGRLKKIKGMKKVQELESCLEFKQNKKIGERCMFAKNGGKCVCSIILFNEDRSRLLADIRRMEKILRVYT